MRGDTEFHRWVNEMKHILLYNIANYEGAVRWHYRGAGFTDVSDCLMEIPGMDADFVLINTEDIGVRAYRTLQKWRELEPNGRRYIMVDSDDLDDWMSEMIDCRVEASRELAKHVTHQEYLEFELFDLTSMGFELTAKEKHGDFNGVCLVGRNRNTSKTMYVIFGYGDYRNYDKLVAKKYLDYDEVYVLIDNQDSRRRMIEDLHDCDYIHDADYKHQLPESLRSVKAMADEKLGMFDPYYW